MKKKNKNPKKVEGEREGMGRGGYRGTESSNVHI